MSDFSLLLAGLSPKKCAAPSNSLIKAVLANGPSDSRPIVFRLVLRQHLWTILASSKGARPEWLQRVESSAACGQKRTFKQR